MRLFAESVLDDLCRSMGIADLDSATIGDVFEFAGLLERRTGVPVIRMDQGSPGLPVNRIGVEAEKRALDSGVVSVYPPLAGIPELKQAASRFVKAFIDIDIDPRGCIPTAGSVEASFASFAIACHRIPGKDKVLFIDPGFSVQKHQLCVLGLQGVSFDIFSHRGARKLEARLRSIMEAGDIAAIIYSNPNNPAWICLEEEELRVIGELATQYDAVVIEDLAYFGMDYRKDLGHPFEAPFVPTVARYTDNYVLLLSASKIFSYAGQRIALACIGDSLFGRRYPELARIYSGSGVFGLTIVGGVLDAVTSGCTVSAQYGYAEMLERSCDGLIDFVADTREYESRAARAKDIFLRNGFHIVYADDVSAPVGDGFFFSLGYGGLRSGELVRELMSYGVSSISLASTGSAQQGVRICVSLLSEGAFPLLEERMSMFGTDHPLS